jgi:hypothetical protein
MSAIFSAFFLLSKEGALPVIPERNLIFRLKEVNHNIYPHGCKVGRVSPGNSGTQLYGSSGEQTFSPMVSGKTGKGVALFLGYGGVFCILIYVQMGGSMNGSS